METGATPGLMDGHYSGLPNYRRGKRYLRQIWRKVVRVSFVGKGKVVRQCQLVETNWQYRVFILCSEIHMLTSPQPLDWKLQSYVDSSILWHPRVYSNIWGISRIYFSAPPTAVTLAHPTI